MNNRTALLDRLSQAALEPSPLPPQSLYVQTVHAIRHIPIDVLQGVAKGQIDLNLLATFELAHRADVSEGR